MPRRARGGAPEAGNVTREVARQPGAKTRSVEKVEKVEKLIACNGQVPGGAATSWPFIGQHKERSQRCLFRSEM